MTYPVSRRSLMLAALSTLTLGKTHAQAVRGPVRFVVPYPAGGATDAVARIYAEEIKHALGVNVVVDNRPGASGQIAAEHVHGAAADGTTFLVTNAHPMVTLPLTVGHTLRYDPVKSFDPISKFVSNEVALVVPGSSPVKTLKEYFDAARAHPSQRAFAVPSVGSTVQFVGLYLAQKESIDLQPVPYKGSAPLTADLLGAQVPAAIDVLATLLEHHKAGKLRILAITGQARHKTLPDVPTFSELGYKELQQPTGWQAIFAPAGTPPAILKKVQEAVSAATTQPRVIQALERLGMDPVGGSSEELRQTVVRDLATWKPIIQASGFKPG